MLARRPLAPARLSSLGSASDATRSYVPSSITPLSLSELELEIVFLFAKLLRMQSSWSECKPGPGPGAAPSQGSRNRDRDNNSHSNLQLQRLLDVRTDRTMYSVRSMHINPRERGGHAVRVRGVQEEGGDGWAVNGPWREASCGRGWRAPVQCATQYSDLRVMIRRRGGVGVSRFSRDGESVRHPSGWLRFEDATSDLDITRRIHPQHHLQGKEGRNRQSVR